MKYLISGGAGFIGSHLAERMVSYGNKVTIADNLSVGSEDNISEISDKVTFVKTDISYFDTDERYDGIFHLASIANPSDYTKAPLELLSSASSGTKRLLEIANDSGACFYYFSSSEVYGHNMELTGEPLSENSYSYLGLLHDRSPYYVSKIFGEEYVKAYCEKLCLDYIIIRPFNVYGTKMDSKSSYGRVITNFMNCAIESMPLIINGDGMQTRSFCYIDDFIEAIILLTRIKNPEYRVLNIGNPNPVSIFELAKIISFLSGKDLPILKADGVPHEPRLRCPDISRIRDMTGWFPETALQDGLLRIFNKMKEGRGLF